MVDQDQRLLRVYPHRAIAETLPAALVDEPACSQLQPTVRLRIADQIREGLTQAFGLRRIHQRVLEEAAGIAQYGGVGQLFPANGADYPAYVPGRRTGDALLLQALAYRPVVQVQPLPPRQAQAHAEDQPAIRLLLEQAIAVAETAGLAIELT